MNPIYLLLYYYTKKLGVVRVSNTWVQAAIESGIFVSSLMEEYEIWFTYVDSKFVLLKPLKDIRIR